MITNNPKTNNKQSSTYMSSQTLQTRFVTEQSNADVTFKDGRLLPIQLIDCSVNMSGLKAISLCSNFATANRLNFGEEYVNVCGLLCRNTSTNTKDSIFVSRRVRQYIRFFEIRRVSLVFTSHSCTSPLTQHLKFSQFFQEISVITESSACFSPLLSILLPGWLCSVTSSVTGVALRLSICGINGVFSLLLSDLTA